MEENMEIETNNLENSESSDKVICKSESENSSSELINTTITEENKDDLTLTGRIGPAPGATIQFKKPLIIGPRKGANKFSKFKALDPENENSSNNEKNSEVPQIPKKLEKSPAEIIAENTVPMPYKEPKWSGLPDSLYSFEVLKSGSIVEKIDLSQKSFHLFGRLGNCDIVMAHPTVSRFHAVMQYRKAGDDNNEPGYYIYDLGSTHGTFLNKNKIKPNIYVRVQVGHMIKVGMSSRNFILQGPTEDEEPESELSVTEIKNLRLQEQLAKEAAERQKLILEELEEEKRRKKEEEGIDWGMGEDADEETDLSENPFAATQNEELYINDPKKTLRGWFEREGYDLDYKCEEKGFGQFVCRVELPIGNSKGLPIIAEAIVRGKKKESVVQCALEACRILDQHGLLRQSNHESKKRKAKNWEDNDYYDSDDDTFLDRTGTVEKKRKARMEQAGIKTNSEVHTYQSLLEKHEKILQDIQKLERELQEAAEEENSAKEKEDENMDELDAYMSSLTKADKKGKTNVRQIKAQLAVLKQEEVNVRNLANLAKPAELPQLKPSLSQTANETKKSNKLPIFGKRKITKKPLQVFAKSEENKNDGEFNNSEEELDSD